MNETRDSVQPHLFECASNRVTVAVGMTIRVVFPIVIAIFVASVLAIRKQSVADAERGN